MRIPLYVFQYMLLLRGATVGPLQKREARVVSIHAPLARSNNTVLSGTIISSRFNTCSSCEEQLRRNMTLPRPKMFQYMLLLRGATASVIAINAPHRFNTCSSCEEQRDVAAGLPDGGEFQYMLLLRGATKKSQFVNTRHFMFQYMLLLRGATGSPACAAREFSFNTCSSCEEQLELETLAAVARPVSIHAPLARSNHQRGNHQRRVSVSIHAPLARSNPSRFKKP